MDTLMTYPVPLKKTHADYAREHLTATTNETVNAARAQAHATLALVEATERLAKAQETANLIARQGWAMGLTEDDIQGMAPKALTILGNQAEEIARRLDEYTS